MAVTSKDLYDALWRMGTEKEAPIHIEIIVQLKKFKMVEISDKGNPRLTHYGEECVSAIKYGGGRVQEFDQHLSEE